MYIVIRKYSTNSQEEVIQKIQQGFVPLISQAPGFIDYYVVPIEKDKVLIVNLFDSEFNGQNSTELAKKWVDENIAHLYSGPAEILEGEAAIAE